MSANQPGGGRRPTKAERKEEARRQRIELQRRMARARRTRTIWLASVVVVALAVGAFLITRPGKPQSTESALPGLLTTTAPWPANGQDLEARLAQLNLPPEGNASHIHSHLDIYVEGSPVLVPPNMGLSTLGSSPIHTHQDFPGIIHAESATQATFTLGEFFDVWGVRLTPTCIGGYCASGDKKLQAWVDGKEFTGNPDSVVLKNHEEIVITFGTKDQLPDPIPASFDFAKFNL